MRLLRRLAYAGLALAFSRVVLGAVARATGAGALGRSATVDGAARAADAMGGPIRASVGAALATAERGLAIGTAAALLALLGAALVRRRDAGVGGPGGVLRAALLAAGIGTVSGALAAGAAPSAQAAVALGLQLALVGAISATVVRAGGLGATADDGESRVTRPVAPVLGAAGGRSTGAAGIAALLAALAVLAGPPATGFALAATLLLVIAVAVAVGVLAPRDGWYATEAGRAGRIALGTLLLQLVVGATLAALALPGAVRTMHESLGALVWLALVVTAALVRRAASPAIVPAEAVNVADERPVAVADLSPAAAAVTVDATSLVAPIVSQSATVDLTPAARTADIDHPTPDPVASSLVAESPVETEAVEPEVPVAERIAANVESPEAARQERTVVQTAAVEVLDEAPHFPAFPLAPSRPEAATVVDEPVVVEQRPDPAPPDESVDVIAVVAASIADAAAAAPAETVSTDVARAAADSGTGAIADTSAGIAHVMDVATAEPEVGELQAIAEPAPVVDDDREVADTAPVAIAPLLEAEVAPAAQVGFDAEYGDDAAVVAEHAIEVEERRGDVVAEPEALAEPEHAEPEPAEVATATVVVSPVEPAEPRAAEPVVADGAIDGEHDRAHDRAHDVVDEGADEGAADVFVAPAAEDAELATAVIADDVALANEIEAVAVADAEDAPAAAPEAPEDVVAEEPLAGAAESMDVPDYEPASYRSSFLDADDDASGDEMDVDDLVLDGPLPQHVFEREIERDLARAAAAARAPIDASVAQAGPAAAAEPAPAAAKEGMPEITPLPRRPRRPPTLAVLLARGADF